MGDGKASQYFKETAFIESIDKHLLKSVDFVVIDMTGYTPEQIAGIRDYVDSLPADQQHRIIRVGF
jgi:hypothetical protein